MNPPRPSLFGKRLAAAAAVLLVALPAGAWAAATKLSETPLQSLNLVKPNIMFTVDDSGSMIFEFVPDYAANGSTPLNSGIYYCRDFRNCGGIIDPVYGVPLDPNNSYLNSWRISQADPPIRSSAYNRLYYDSSFNYGAGKKEDGTDLPCEGSNTACTGPWTSVYKDGFYGYPGSAASGGTANLVSGFLDTVWCNNLAHDPPTSAEINTAFSENDGTLCRLNGRPYKAGISADGLWTMPAKAAGYNYPNRIDQSTGNRTTCGAANEKCEFYIPASISSNPYYYTTTQVQFCKNAAFTISNPKTAGYPGPYPPGIPVNQLSNTTILGSGYALPAPATLTGFGVDDGTGAGCSDRWDQNTYKYARFTRSGAGAATSFDPLAFTRVDIAPTGILVNGKPSTLTPTGRTYAQEMANFARWYAFHRSRNLAIKTAGGIAFAPLTDEDARVGLHTLRFGWSNGYVSNKNDNGNPFLNVLPFDRTNKATWFRSFYGLKMGGGTPLPDAMYRIGEYFSGNLANSGLPGAADPLDPVTGRCQQNYHLMSTDGYWNFQLNPAAAIGDRDRTVPTLPGPVPGFTTGSAFPPPYSEGTTSTGNSLSDLAMYYWIRDLRPSLSDNVKDTLAPWQHVNFYALAIGAQGNIVYPTGIDDITAGKKEWPVPTGSERADSVDDLWHAAVNGRGQFYNPASSQQLGESIVAAVAEFTSQSGTGTAIGIAGAQLTATKKYGYRTSYETGNWGDVRKYALDAATGALPVKPDGNPLFDPVWTAAATLDAQALDTGWDTNRRIVTMKEDGKAAIPFRIGNLSGKQKDALNKGWASVSPTPTADQVLNYLRGDRSNEGDGTTNFRIRTHVLGDIVYSGAVPVGAPAQPYDDTGNPGYKAFVTAKSGRTPMVYVGANDGMLHAFVDSTTTDAGKEAWAYVPLALYTATNPNNPSDPTTADSRTFQLGALSFRRGGIPPFKPKFYVNATPRVWDVDLKNTNTNTPPKTGNDWRTLLVGGLGAGGRSVYALDVTTPVTLAESEDDIVASKRVLWEFTDDHLGYVYDSPTLVKTYRYGWVVLVASGYNNPGGKGILYILNPKNGDILKTLSPDEPGNLDPDSADPKLLDAGGTASDSNPRGLSTIRAYTASRKDPYVLQAYGGDLHGNVWRFDLSDPDEKKWKVALIAKFKDAGGKEQPITTGVRVEIDQSNNVDRYLFVGTGKLLDQSDLVDVSVRNSVYVVKDGTRTTPEPPPPEPYSRATLNTVNGATTAGFTGTATGRGWYQDAANAQQKVITDVYADVQTVVYAFSEPANDPCEASLTATLYARDFAAGASVLESPAGTVVASVSDVGAIAGLALIQGQPGTGSAASGDVRAQVTTMKGQVFSFGVKLAGGTSSKHRVSWRLLSKD